MKKFILGITLLIIGAIGYMGTLLVCVVNEIAGAFESIFTCMEFNGGTPLAVFSGILFFAGLGLSIYSIIKEKPNSEK